MKDITSKEDLNAFVEKGIKCMAFFYISKGMTGRCKDAEKKIELLKEKFPNMIPMIKVNADDHKELTKSMKIKNFPTLVVYDEGKEVEREEGRLSDEYLMWLMV